ncbi:transcriptional regulator [Oceanobacillus oncorhynchi]|uniref:transcriptional regulator n=1 Tax=Oceanobacillus oncorhynchi TaxID=545501 RepID=UPI00186642FD|nr:transcriptional regulator [Oceanobacillus oncorhynchi]
MSTVIKPTKVTFKKVESEWYNYHHTLKEINRLREAILTPFDEDQDENVGGGENSVRIPSDPTGKMATRLTTNKQLEYLNTIVQAIDQVYNALPDDYKQLIRLRYWSKNRQLTWEGIAVELHVSKRQAMRWRNEIIQATVEVLGWR